MPEAVVNPIPSFAALDGSPLTGAAVYFGQPHRDPREHPIPVYYDAQLSVEAKQPLRTAGGYILHNDQPATVWARGGYSMLVVDRSGRGVLFCPVSGGARAMTPEDFKPATTTAEALKAAEVAHPDGVGLQLPTGVFQLESGFVGTKDRMALIGAGRWATVLEYNQAGSALTFNKQHSGGYNQGRLTDVGFRSTSAAPKTMVDLVNVANFEVARIATNDGTWPGDSIGIRTRGRQLVHIHGCEIRCARPIVLSPNTTWPSLATDHFLIENNELSGSSAARDVIEIESGVSFASTTIRHTAIVAGRHGIYWNDRSVKAASFCLLIDEIRTEQGMVPSAWSVYLASTSAPLQNVRISNSYLDSERNGIMLRNAQRVEIDNVTFVGRAGRVALDMAFVQGSRLILRNFLVLPGATVKLENAKCIRREMVGDVLTEEWVHDGVDPWVQSDALHSGRPVLVQPGSTLRIADASFCGFIDVMTSDRAAATLFWDGGAFQVMADPVGAFGNGKSPVAYTLQRTGLVKNNRADPVTFYVFRRGAKM